MPRQSGSSAHDLNHCPVLPLLHAPHPKTPSLGGTDPEKQPPFPLACTESSKEKEQGPGTVNKSAEHTLSLPMLPTLPGSLLGPECSPLTELSGKQWCGDLTLGVGLAGIFSGAQSPVLPPVAPAEPQPSGVLSLSTDLAGLTWQPLVPGLWSDRNCQPLPSPFSLVLDKGFLCKRQGFGVSAPSRPPSARTRVRAPRSGRASPQHTLLWSFLPL